MQMPHLMYNSNTNFSNTGGEWNQLAEVRKDMMQKERSLENLKKKKISSNQDVGNRNNDYNT